MSVINDMLRDLEQRKAAGRDGMSQSGALSIVESAPPGLRTWLLGLLIVLLALGLGVWLWQSAPFSSGPEAAPVAVMAASDAAAEGVQSASVVTPVAPESAPVVVVPAGSMLSTPVAAVVAADNVEVKPGAPVDKVPVARDTPKPDTPEVAATPKQNTSRNDAAKKDAPKKETPNKVSLKMDMSKKEKVAAASKPVAKPAPVQVLVDGEQVDMVQVQAAPKPLLSLTPQAQDQKVAGEAQALLRRGETGLAYRLLITFLQEAETDSKSRAVLVNYLLQAERLAEAGDLLLAAPIEQDADLRQLKARWLVANARLAEAISLLESRKPELPGFPDYHALLASYYQQAAQAEQAAGIYAELIAFDAAQANWWAGRALALDRLARYVEAKTAYQRALALPGLSEQLVQFAKQRLDSL